MPVLYNVVQTRETISTGSRIDTKLAKRVEIEEAREVYNKFSHRENYMSNDFITSIDVLVCKESL